MSTDKTLADVQPGGRVRLGDQAERARFEAWARELLPCPFCGNSAEFVPYKDNGLTLKCKSMGCIQRNQRTLRYGIDWLRTSMAEHWNTRALSAQPSPGGQGDTLELLEAYDQAVEDLSAERSDGWNEDNRRPQLEADVAELRAELVAALAARQPVGEPVAWMTHHDEPMLFPTAAEAAAYCEDDEQPAPLFRSPAQTVDLGDVIEQIAQQWDGCSYDAVGETIDVGQAIRAAGKRLAPIDGKAVDK